MYKHLAIALALFTVIQTSDADLLGKGFYMISGFCGFSISQLLAVVS